MKMEGYLAKNKENMLLATDLLPVYTIGRYI
jgi:hypothetical protein